MGRKSYGLDGNGDQLPHRSRGRPTDLRGRRHALFGEHGSGLYHRLMLAFEEYSAFVIERQPSSDSERHGDRLVSQLSQARTDRPM
jgi:hypothetical protein